MLCLAFHVGTLHLTSDPDVCTTSTLVTDPSPKSPNHHLKPICFDVLGIKPRALRLLDKCSTTKLHPSLQFRFVHLNKLIHSNFIIKYPCEICYVHCVNFQNALLFAELKVHSLNHQGFFYFKPGSKATVAWKNRGRVLSPNF